MIDIENLRKNPDIYRDSMKRRNRDASKVDRFLEVDKKWRALTQEHESMRASQKKLGADLARQSPSDGGEEIKNEAKALKEKMQSIDAELKDLAPERDRLILEIPNVILADVPTGKDETENKVLRQWGTVPKFDFELKDHVELGQKLNLIDNDRAAKISGARFTYIKGGAAMLQLAIMNLAFETLTTAKTLKKIADKVEKGYNPKPFIPVFVPDMIKDEPYRRAGRLTDATHDDKFYLEKDELYLAGSAEHTLATMYMDEILPESDLPIRYIGYSTSFRREAGSYGKDTRGILRMHQFDKLEMESFTTPENSEKEQRFFVAIQEYLMQSLNIPYQVVAICTGDMADPDARQIDIEAWMPGQDKYRETHTSDLMLDYQTRGLNTKIKRSDGTTVFAHTNDATAFALGRILIAIIENNQTKQGTIKVPKVLQQYLSFKEIKPSH